MFFFCPNCGASAHIQAATCLICDYDLKHWKAENVIKNPIDAEFMLNYATRCVNCGTVFTNAYVFCPKCHTSKYGGNEVIEKPAKVDPQNFALMQLFSKESTEHAIGFIQTMNRIREDFQLKVRDAEYRYKIQVDLIAIARIRLMNVIPPCSWGSCGNPGAYDGFLIDNTHKALCFEHASMILYAMSADAYLPTLKTISRLVLATDL